MVGAISSKGFPTAPELGLFSLFGRTGPRMVKNIFPVLLDNFPASRTVHRMASLNIEKRKRNKVRAGAPAPNLYLTESPYLYRVGQKSDTSRTLHYIVREVSLFWPTL